MLRRTSASEAVADHMVVASSRECRHGQTAAKSCSPAAPEIAIPEHRPDSTWVAPLRRSHHFHANARQRFRTTTTGWASNVPTTSVRMIEPGTRYCSPAPTPATKRIAIDDRNSPGEWRAGAERAVLRRLDLLAFRPRRHPAAAGRAADDGGGNPGVTDAAPTLPWPACMAAPGYRPADPATGSAPGSSAMSGRAGG